MPAPTGVASASPTVARPSIMGAFLARHLEHRTAAKGPAHICCAIEIAGAVGDQVVHRDEAIFLVERGEDGLFPRRLASGRFR